MLHSVASFPFLITCLFNFVLCICYVSCVYYVFFRLYTIVHVYALELHAARSLLPIVYKKNAMKEHVRCASHVTANVR